MEFAEDIPITFKEITPSLTIVEKWKEITLDTGGTHSTLQDIKLPPKAGGYWYKDSLKINTKNRFIYWQTTSDAIELNEASFDINLTTANVRCKVAPTTPPLGGVTIWEHFPTNQVIILLATVSSVHRLKFPHPEVFDKKSTFGSLSNSSPSIFHHTPTVTDPKNYHILNQYSNQGVAHTCASLLRENGEAVFALAFGHGGDGGLLVVKLPTNGSAVTLQLKRESNVPRFLSGITGALRGKSGHEGEEPHGVVVSESWTVSVHGDGALRAWHTAEGGAPVALAPPFTNSTLKPKQPPHGHMLQKAQAIDGSILIVAYLSFPTENEFVVMKLHDAGGGAVKFTNICRIIGPQLDLLDYNIGFGDGNNVIWALWSQTDGDTIITSSAIGTEVSWRCVANKEPPPPLPQLASHQQYRDRLLVAGLFPPAVIRKALAIYVRTWGGGASEVSAKVDLGESALSAVQSRIRHLAARTDNPDHSALMHKCWSDLYSWCMQYMEGLQKPLGLMLSDHVPTSGWWCAVIRRAGLSLVLPLEPLEQIMLASHHDHLQQDSIDRCVSYETRLVVWAGAVWSRLAGTTAAAALERTLLSTAAPLNALTRLTQHPVQEMLTPQQFDEITAILEPIKDLQSAVLELNDALRLDVPELDVPSDEEDSSEYDNLFSSELGVSLVTESVRQMAEMRSRIVLGALVALWSSRGADGVPGAGHCAVHWQAYRALNWLYHAPIHPQGRAPEESFRLCVQEVWGAGATAGPDGALRGLADGALRGLDGGALRGLADGALRGLEGRALRGLADGELRGLEGGALRGFAGGRGGRAARGHLQAATAPTTAHAALPLYTHHLAYQLYKFPMKPYRWAVSGGFEFGSWLATINQPRLVQNYVNLLEPWCEWNACSRRFILGLALLDLEDFEGAYAAFSHAAKGVGKEPLLRTLVDNQQRPHSQHQALVLYYMKVIKLFEIHDAGEYVVRLAETAISIADKDDPNLNMFQWVVFKWRLSRGDTAGALSAAAACPAPATRAAAASALLHALGTNNKVNGDMWSLVRCGALATESERAAGIRARLHDAHTHNPYYDYLFALHVYRQHYRKAASIAYERACRCGLEADAGADTARRRWTAAALSALKLAHPDHAFITHPDAQQRVRVLGPEDLESELRKDDPNCMNPVQKALQSGDKLDFNQLYPYLMKAEEDTLLAVTKRVISTEQFLPHWFLQRYLDVSGHGCVGALYSAGRCTEATAAAARALRAHCGALCPLSAPPPPSLSTAALDLLLAELHGHDDVDSTQAYQELKQAVDEYTNIVERTSNDMKEANIGFHLNN